MNSQKGGLIQPYVRELRWFAVTADLFIATGALWLAHTGNGSSWAPHYSLAAAVIAIIFYIVARTLGLYRSWRSEPLRREVTQLAYVWIVLGVAILFIGYATKSSHEYSRLTFGIWYWLSPLALLGWRVAIRGFLRASRADGYNSRRVAIAGNGPSAEQVARTFQESPWMGLRLIASYDDRAVPRDNHELPVPRIGDIDALIAAARAGEYDVIYITLPMQASERIKQLIDSLADTTVSVYLVPDYLLFHLTHGRWIQVGEIPAVSVYETPFYGGLGAVKRVEDLVIGSICMLLAALPMLAIAVGIKLTSRGPVMFKQRRWGVDGHEFLIWKFRSMTTTDDGPVVQQATRDDPRVTPFGKFLRRTSLDELPQLFNVLGGSMSIIGPRPHPSAHNEDYRTRIHGYMLRHMIKPGITGWAQANGWRGETDTPEKMEKRIEYDLWYIHNWSLLLDFQILLRTARHLMRGENAY